MLMPWEPEADMSVMRIAKLGPGDLSAFKAIRLESLRLAPTAFANTEADWSGLRVLVVGLGLSGFAAADALHDTAHDARHAMGLPCH